MKNLNEAHPKLQRVFNEVIKHFDCSVIEGYRLKEEQDAAYHNGRTKVQWPDSKHNTYPTQAVDVIPWPVNWKDTERFYYFAGFVKGIARSMGIKLRWGGDWDSDTEVKDQDFNDLPHFELHPDEPLNDDVLPNGPSDDEINNKLEDVE
jgi:hypothetical protein